MAPLQADKLVHRLFCRLGNWLCFLCQSKRRVIQIFPLLPDPRLRDNYKKKGGQGEAEKERAGKAWDLLEHTLFSRWVC